MQVGQRIVSKPNSKPYGILAVVFQLYCQPRLHFTLPPSVFFPRPKVCVCVRCTVLCNGMLCCYIPYV
jgi:16S rRNA A1518/A1519 N6-dimethyltransferase RsmA/KsgA/DIM1 with predicted DNA glycosylase/AP lyase activity